MILISRWITEYVIQISIYHLTVGLSIWYNLRILIQYISILH